MTTPINPRPLICNCYGSVPLKPIPELDAWWRKHVSALHRNCEGCAGYTYGTCPRTLLRETEEATK
jgi:hypothetical protein